MQTPMVPSRLQYTGKTEPGECLTKRFFVHVERSSGKEIPGTGGFALVYESPEQELAHAQRLHWSRKALDPDTTLGEWIEFVKNSDRVRTYI